MAAIVQFTARGANYEDLVEQGCSIACDLLGPDAEDFEWDFTHIEPSEYNTATGHVKTWRGYARGTLFA